MKAHPEKTTVYNKLLGVYLFLVATFYVFMLARLFFSDDPFIGIAILFAVPFYSLVIFLHGGTAVALLLNKAGAHVLALLCYLISTYVFMILIMEQSNYGDKELTLSLIFAVPAIIIMIFGAIYSFKQTKRIT